MDDIQTELRDGICVATLARPARHNALTVSLLAGLERAVQVAEAEPAVRALVVTGQGERAFCAGADLKERRSMSDAEVRGFLDACRSAFDAIERLRKPVIAAINGVALGGGLELALACHLRVGTSSAVLGLPETALGIIPGAGGTQRLPRVVGLARATQMLLLAERFDAAEAHRIGLLHRVAAAGESALECALELASPFRTGAPLALAAALEALAASAELPLAQGLAVERACYERTLASRDRREALEAFAEKRKPQFRGD